MPPFFSQAASSRAKLARRKSEISIASASASAYEALLQRGSDPDLRTGVAAGVAPAVASASGAAMPQYRQQRAWLDAADARRSAWSGERPMPRKLVKDPSGSARPLFSMAIADGADGSGSRRPDRDAEARASAADGIRRAVARWKELRISMSGPSISPGGLEVKPNKLHRRER